MISEDHRNNDADEGDGNDMIQSLQSSDGLHSGQKPQSSSPSKEVNSFLVDSIAQILCKISMFH